MGGDTAERARKKYLLFWRFGQSVIVFSRREREHFVAIFCSQLKGFFTYFSSLEDMFCAVYHLSLCKRRFGLGLYLQQITCGRV